MHLSARQGRERGSIQIGSAVGSRQFALELVILAKLFIAFIFVCPAACGSYSSRPNPVRPEVFFLNGGLTSSGV